MDIAHETSLVAKAVWSAAIVLGLSFVAERVSTRIAGILSGSPQNAVLVYAFVGYDMGTDYVVRSVPHGIASFTATLCFVLAYWAVSSVVERFGTLASAAVGVVVFVAVAAALFVVPFDLASAVGMTLGAIVLAAWLFRRIALVPVERPVRYTARLLLLRGSFAASLIVGVITLAEMLGPRWTGLLAGFPTTLLPTLVILHGTYGRASAHAVIRNFPLGVVSIILYILSVPVTFRLWGVFGGTAASLAISIAYLVAVVLPGTRRRERARARTGGP